MKKIAIYGKGGIGKSVISTNLSAYFGKSGKRVLHVGCDPKCDSSLKLAEGKKITTVLEAQGHSPETLSAEMIINRGKFDIHCIESGGPQPGVGCGGRGVARTIEVLSELNVLDPKNYDIAVFDVLGDVVCGGFAAPLRSGMADEAYIVITNEPMALFAANNIAKAIRTYADNGIKLGGLIANLRSEAIDRKFLEKFASKLNTKIIQFISRDDMIIEAEKKNMTVIEYDYESKSAKEFQELAKRIERLNLKNIPLPTPMEDAEYFDFIKKG